MAASERNPLIMGIPNCDSVKKARAWLDARTIPYQFRDFRKQPLSRDEVASLLARTGTAAFVNRRSSSWRALDDAGRKVVETAIAAPAGAAEQTALVALMTENQTMIKRPVLVLQHHTGTGFSAADWDRVFASQAE